MDFTHTRTSLATDFAQYEVFTDLYSGKSLARLEARRSSRRRIAEVVEGLDALLEGQKNLDDGQRQRDGKHHEGGLPADGRKKDERDHDADPESAPCRSSSFEHVIPPRNLRDTTMAIEVLLLEVGSSILHHTRCMQIIT